MIKIVFLDAGTLGNLHLADKFLSLGDFVTYSNTSADLVAERIQDAEVVITNKVVLDKNALERANKLQLICVAATGMNNIDLEYTELKGIAVKNVKGYSTDSVAQHTFALILNMVNQVAFYDNYVKSNTGYVQSKFFSNFDRTIFELKDKTIGIIGLGAIGKRVAEIAVCFGMNVIYFSTSGKNFFSNYTSVDLNLLLEQSDIVSIHAPLNQITEKLISYEKLCRMKSSAILVNTGRGGIVVESDLARALNEDKISMAALDVFEKEPISTDNPLLNLKNPEKIIFSPHVAWASLEARTRLVQGVVNNIKDFFG